MPYNTQRNRILRTYRLTRPTCFHNPVAETLAHLRSIRTVCPVNLDTSAHGYKSEYIIPIDRVTAFGQFKFQSFQILINDQYILFELGSS